MLSTQQHIFGAIYKAFSNLISKLFMRIFGLTYEEVTWEKYMGNWHEPDSIPAGNDDELYEVFLEDGSNYNYDTVFTIENSKQKFGNPSIGQLCWLLRKICQDIMKVRNKQIIGYFAGSDIPSPGYRDIHNEDVRYIAGLLKDINKNVQSVDFILSSPGGFIEASKKITDMIRNRFEQLSFILPGGTYSAATAMTFAGDEIIMCSYANMSPINPRVNGIDTYLGKQYYRTYKRYATFAPWALKHLNEAKIVENNVTMKVLRGLEKNVYRVAYNHLATHLFKVKQKTLINQLKLMLKIKKIVKYFTNFKKHLSHNVPFSIKELLEVGLPIKTADCILDSQLMTINNICTEIVLTTWYNGGNKYDVRKIFFNDKRCYTIKFYS